MTVEVAGPAELRELLAGRPGRVRLAGAGSRGDRVPPPPPGALRVSLRRLDGIARLEPDDLTCSVGAGVPAAHLAGELAARNLELGFGPQPGAGDAGTVGGLFAADPLGPANVGAPCPRSALLGIEAVLAGGEPFRSGARVVKSVAGFDVHRLLVGSAGRLFAATLLHVRLRPRPRSSVAFATAPLERGPALERFLQLRASGAPLPRLVLRATGQGCRIEGRCAGRVRQVADTLARHGLPEAPEAPGPGDDHLQAGEGTEVVAGIARPSRLPDLLRSLPEGAPWLVHGGGRFEVALAAAAADRLLAALPDLQAAGSVVAGPAERRGRASPGDPGAERLMRGLARALDPEGTFV